MIRIETKGCENKMLSVQGDRHLICLETLLLLTKLIQSDIVKDKDKEIIKLVLDMNKEMLSNFEQELKNTLIE